jgi:tetratricopeptide (TPR) repeat protein
MAAKRLCDNRFMRLLLRNFRGVLLCVTVLALPNTPLAGEAAPAPAVQAADPAELVKQAGKLSTEGKQDEALALYRRALERAPDSFDAHLGAGVACDLRGDYAEARKHFTKALELAAEDGKNQALTAMGVSYAFDRDIRNAAKFYQQVFDREMTLSDYAGAADAADALGGVYLESGDFENALKWYQTAYETARRQPDLPGAQLDLGTMRWAAAQARIAVRRGNGRVAREQSAIVKSRLDKGTNPDQQVQYLYLAGYVDFYLKDYTSAIAELQRADQGDPFVLMLLAQAYEKIGDNPKALECYQRVLTSTAHTPNNAFARPTAKKKLRT